MNWLRNKSVKLKSAALALVLLCGNIFGMALPFMPSQVASAALLCKVDTAGANDVPNQKDLTQMCVDYVGLPNTIATTWGWDDLGTSGGGNTMDACNLFDTDGDGNANFAVCVATVDKNPAAFSTLTTYSCGDARADRCELPNAVISNGTTLCAVTQPNNDPFPTGSFSPEDTQGSCTIQLAAVGGSSAKLIDVCSYPSGQPNSAPSDCVIAKANSGKLEVIKSLSPSTDVGKFNLQINGTTYRIDAGDGDATGEVVVPMTSNQNSNNVGELAGTGTSLANYTSGIVCKNLNGTGSIVAQGTGTSLVVSVADGSDIVCIITNTLKEGSIKVVKDVINDNGGTKTYADFTFQNNGGAAQNFVATTSPDGEKVLSLPVGTAFAITEVGASTMTDYAASYSGTCTGTVTLTQQTCTITNNDIAPTLTLVKTVTNNNGGNKTAADFQAKIDGTNVAWSTAVPLSAGAHTATEVTLSTYTPSAWGGDCATNGTITLLPGDNKTCTITNDDIAPSLTLNKILVDSFGGSYTEASWLLTADGSVTDLSGNGATGSTDVVSGSGFYAGSYTLSESGPTTGITSSTWNCGNTVVTTSNVISILLGQIVTCTITNTTVQPKITLVKAIGVNQYGDTSTANDFGLTIGGVAATSGTTYGKNVGSYAINEASKTGYSFVNITGDAKCPASLGGTVTLALGDDITCTIHNQAIQPKLTVTKVVTNDNGGNKVIADFPLFVGQTSVTSGEQNGFNEATYTISETGQTGYVGTITGDCAADGAVTLSLGDDKHCTITNDDIAPSLTLYKQVKNDNSGKSFSSDWTLIATPEEGDILSGNGDDGFVSKAALSHVTYTLGESGPDGYTASEWRCDSNNEGEFSYEGDSTNKISMNEGADVTCYITNDDIPHPAIKVVKSGPASAAAGSIVKYTFTVTNAGDVELADLMVVDSITGDVTYVSGDIDDDNKLDITETWILTATYTIPANQTANVVNTVKACGYDSELPQIDEQVYRTYDDGETEDSRVLVCDEDSHTLSIPQVLGEVKLVDTGTPLVSVLNAVALFNLAAVLALIVINKKTKTNN